MAPTPEEVNNKFIDIVLSRSGGGVLGLAKNFRIIDKDRSGSLSFSEFKVAMTKFRVGLSATETKILFDFYDKDGSGSLEFNEFLKGLRSKLSPQRRELSEQAFAEMDVDKSGEINFEDLKAKYDTSHHPKVISGEMTHEQAINEFIKTFEGDEGNKDGTITMEEWMDYHVGISANIDEDDAFGILLANNWGIEYIPKKQVENIKTLIKNKATQKGGGNPKKVAMDTFKFFDTNGSKSIDYTEFGKAMETFAPNLSEKELKTFFGMFDHDNSGEIEYQELLDLIFN